jgi:hypothetical protein
MELLIKHRKKEIRNASSAIADRRIFFIYKPLTYLSLEKS